MIKKHSDLNLFKEIIKSWKRRCKNTKITLKDLAKCTKISEQQISRIINGHSKSTIKTIGKIEMTLRELENDK